MRNPKITLVRSKAKKIKYKTLCVQKWTVFRIFTLPQYFAFFSVNALFKSKEKVIFVISNSGRIRICVLKRKLKFVETLNYAHLTFIFVHQSIYYFINYLTVNLSHIVSILYCTVTRSL